MSLRPVSVNCVTSSKLAWAAYCSPCSLFSLGLSWAFCCYNENTMAKSNLGRKGFISVYSLRFVVQVKSGQELKQSPEGVSLTGLLLIALSACCMFAVSVWFGFFLFLAGWFWFFVFETVSSVLEFS